MKNNAFIPKTMRRHHTCYKQVHRRREFSMWTTHEFLIWRNPTISITTLFVWLYHNKSTQSPELCLSKLQQDSSDTNTRLWHVYSQRGTRLLRLREEDDERHLRFVESSGRHKKKETKIIRSFESKWHVGVRFTSKLYKRTLFK